jgi:hypothetical protein
MLTIFKAAVPMRVIIMMTYHQSPCCPGGHLPSLPSSQRY